MSTRAQLDQRAASAKALAASAIFGEAEQISWASLPRARLEAPGPHARSDLTHALVDAVERHACVEFVCGLLLDGADPTALSDDEIPLWRAAVLADARRSDGSGAGSGWALLAALALGRAFLSHPSLPALRDACDRCVAELQSHMAAQDAHFVDQANARRSGELYSLLDARHDGAFGLLASQVAALARQDQRPPGPPPSTRP